LVGGVDQGGGFFGGEVGDRAPLKALGWDREDPLDDGGVLGV